MARYDFNAQRLFLKADLAEGTMIDLSLGQANYVKNVLRLKEGDTILVFNGQDGERRASIADAGKRGATLRIGAKVRDQEDGPDIDYLFAPLKRARLDYMVQKATEMGVGRIQPV
ncbi:MAG: RsmE family RNA methyltransferase, partial [Hyphomicrobiaceae bacterium]|nr:RsmE family RNA methyltransferase [Hyphomicrobiaceae bacterium]